MRSIALTLSLVLIFLIPWEGVIRFPGLGTGARVLGLVVGVVWLAKVVSTGQLRKPAPFHLMVGLFVLWNALSVFWSANPGRTVAHLITWAQILGLVFILWDLYTTRTALLAGLQAYVLGAFVAIGSAVANYFAGRVFYTNYQRFSPGETNPDGFGFLLALGIPVAWYLASVKSTSRTSYLLRIINFAYIPAAFLGLALSGTRTALIASVVGMAFGISSLTRLRLAARTVIFLLLASAILILLPYVQSLESFQRLGTTGAEITGGDLNNRENNWREGVASFLEHPLIGVGSNMYRSVNTLGKVGHNSFISVLVELGLVGSVLFGMILVIAITQALRQPQWEMRFWLTILTVWNIGAFTLTWEARKSTWIFLSFVVVSAALTLYRDRQTYTATPLKGPTGQMTSMQKEVVLR